MELLLLLFVLGIVTLVGHGIWVMLAAFFRLLSGAASVDHQAALRHTERCAGCGEPLRPTATVCPVCRLGTGSRTARELNELNGSIAQVRGLAEREEIDAATGEQVIALLRARRRQLLGEPATPRPAAPPPIPSPPVKPAAEAVRLTPAVHTPLHVSDEILDVIPVEPMPLPPILASDEPAALAPAPPPPPPPPRRSLGEMLSGFMEARNILWGELVGGLLIVGCSIALVLTLWQTLQAIPYFPFLLFTALTGALFAAGEYTLHHWKLAATSRGLLLISLLLVPLNLLILADPAARGNAPFGVAVDVLVGLLAVTSFVLLVRWSAGDLIGTDTLPGPVDRRWLLAAGVVAPPALQLLGPLAAGALSLLAGTSVGCAVAAALAVVGGLSGYGTRTVRVSGTQAQAMLTFLGASTFAVLASLGYLLTHGGPVAELLHDLAVPVVLLGVPACLFGLLLSERMEEGEPSGYRAGGTALLLGGCGFMLVGAALAWPAAGGLLIALLLAGLLLTSAGQLFRVPWLLGTGTALLVAGGLIGYHLATGQVGPDRAAGAAALVAALMSAPSAVVLVVAALLLHLPGWWLQRRGESALAWSIDGVGLGVAGVALMLATHGGMAHSTTAAVVHGAAAVAFLLLSVRRPGEVLPQAAGAVTVLGSLWALHATLPGRPEWWGVALAAEALVLAAIQVACAWRNLSTHAHASGAAGLLAGLLALGFALTAPRPLYEYHLTGTLTLLSMAVLVPAVWRRDPWWFTAFQTGVTLAVVAGVTALAAERDWVGELPQVQAYGVALAALAAAWVGGRKALAGRPGWERVFTAFTPGVDEITIGFSVLGLLLLSGWGAWLGVAAEWGVAGIAAQAVRYAEGGAWLWLAVAAVAPVGMLLAPARDGELPRRQGALFCLMLLGVTTAALEATTHANDLATATALRWSLAVTFLLGSALLWGREQFDRVATTVRLVGAPVGDPLVGLLGVVAVIVLLMTAILVGQGFEGVVLPGPLSTSVYARMGTLAASLGPVVLVIVALVGSAVSERSPGCALAGQVLAGVSVFGGFLLGLKQAGVPFTPEHPLLAAFLASAVLAVGGAGWMAGRQRVGEDGLLSVAAWLGLAVVFVTMLVVAPRLLLTARAARGGPLGLPGCGVAALALVLSAATAWWHATVRTPRRRIDVLGFAGLTAGILLCCVGEIMARTTPWPVLAAVWSLLGLLFVLAGSFLPLTPHQWARLFPTRRVRGWAVVLIVVQVVVAFDAWFLPVGWPFVGEAAVATLAAALVAGAVAGWYRRGGFVTLSGLLFTLALVLLDLPAVARLVGYPALAPWPMANYLAIPFGLALSAAFWSGMRFTDPRAARRRDWLALPYPPGATVVALALFLFVVPVAITSDAGAGAGFGELGAIGWATALAIGLALAVAVWGGRTDYGLPCLYLHGLGTLGLAISAAHPTGRQLVWIGPLALATQVTLASLTALVWSMLYRQPASQPTRFQLAHPVVPYEVWSWLMPAQGVFGGLALVLGAVAAVHDLPLLERLAGPATAVLLLGATAALGRVAPALWAETMRLIALGLMPALLGLLAWAIPDPNGPAAWLERTAWLFGGLTLAGGLGLELPRWPAGRRQALVVTGVAGMVLLTLLGMMIPAFAPALKRTPLSGEAILAVGVAIAALMALLVRLAVRPDHDPLALSERGRTGYVYLAELLLVVLFIHLRLNVPELFGGFLARYWTFLVLSAAFVGVGLGEWFDRQGVRVLAGPLNKTGILLPLVPVLAFWARPPHALLAYAEGHAPGLLPLLESLQRVPMRFDVYSLVWFITSMLYLFVALSRRSTWWAIVAAVAANAGFWAVLAHVGVGFLVHPQAWLIPLAVIVLLAEYLHRDELDARLAETLRYLGVTLIYVASTADLFIAGLGNSAWLPVLLAALCVAGILVGMLFRIRAFLFLGLGFLLLDVLSMIWYAAVDRAHTWLWWAAGIVLGTAILALFAVFEKRKNDVLTFLDDLKQWD